MLFFTILMVFASVFMLVYGVLAHINKTKLEIEKRIDQIKNIHSIVKDKEQGKSFSDRILRPIYETITQLLTKLTPSHNLSLFYSRLERGGLLKNSSKEKWLYTKGMLSLTIAALVALLVYSLDANIFKAFTMAAIIMVSVNVFFNFYLSKAIEARKQKILRDLPYTLDLITVSVEAGLSFDGAMARVVNNIKGELCDEFGKSLKEIRMGIERKVALRNMSKRCEVDELSMFITSVIQADDLGVSLGRVLRIEAENLREHRKQVAREKAMKAPIKMLFPLVFFIFPAIFIIILGPAVINIINVFAGR